MPGLGIGWVELRFWSVLFTCTCVLIPSGVVLFVCVRDIFGAVYDLAGSLVLLRGLSCGAKCSCCCVSCVCSVVVSTFHASMFTNISSWLCVSCRCCVSIPPMPSFPVFHFLLHCYTYVSHARGQVTD